MKKHDRGSDNSMLVFKYGTPLTLRLSEEVRHPVVLSQVLEWQDDKMGKRCRLWKTNGGFGKTTNR